MFTDVLRGKFFFDILISLLLNIEFIPVTKNKYIPGLAVVRIFLALPLCNWEECPAVSTSKSQVSSEEGEMTMAVKCHHAHLHMYIQKSKIPGDIIERNLRRDTLLGMEG